MTTKAREWIAGEVESIVDMLHTRDVADIANAILADDGPIAALVRAVEAALDICILYENSRCATDPFVWGKSVAKEEYLESTRLRAALAPFIDKHQRK